MHDNSDYYFTIILLPYPPLLSGEQYFVLHLQFENAREIFINETSINKTLLTQSNFYVIYILYILYYISLLYVILYYVILK